MTIGKVVHHHPKGYYEVWGKFVKNAVGHILTPIVSEKDKNADPLTSCRDSKTWKTFLFSNNSIWKTWVMCFVDHHLYNLIWVTIFGPLRKQTFNQEKEVWLVPKLIGCGKLNRKKGYRLLYIFKLNSFFSPSGCMFVTSLTVA